MKKCGCKELIQSNFNTFEKIVMTKYPALKETKYWLSSFGRVRMSGTGSTLYIEYDNYESAEKANREIGRKYKSLMVSSLKSYDVFS
jgi:4-diphosphocytidyl-2C-methyl-D-erythritol kinase